MIASPTPSCIGHSNPVMSVEEVIIATHSSAPADIWESTGRELNKALVQDSKSGRRKFRFELFNQQILSVSIEQARNRTRVYELYTWMLDPKPVRSLSVSWHHLALFLVFSLATVLAGTSVHTPHPVALTAGLGACAGLALAVAAGNSHFRLVFHSRTGRIPLVTFLCRKPDPGTFNHFIEILVKHIDNTDCRNAYTNADETLNAELREHRRLMEAGIISANSYQTAKALILGKHH